MTDFATAQILRPIRGDPGLVGWRACAGLPRAHGAYHRADCRGRLVSCRSHSPRSRHRSSRGRARGVLSQGDEKKLVHALIEVPRLMVEALALEPQIEHLARDLAKSRDVLYLGRGTSYPLALEGALKLKEISYIHAEGYAAGELKHGPIALIDENMPVIV